MDDYKTMHTIALIGSGPTAIYTAHYLLARGSNLNITMFETQTVAGKGTPYHQDWNNEAMLSNIASIELPPIKETLVTWLNRQDELELAKMGIAREHIDERVFFPRVVLGNYFQAQLAHLVAQPALQGNRLTVKPSHHVMDVMVEDNAITLIVRDDEQATRQLNFSHVVMATGHAWPKETEAHPGYFLAPWPVSALNTIGHCHVGILGTSLSAIDALVALSVARGSFRKDADGVLSYLPEPGTEAFHVTLMSRKGLLPEADFYYPLPYEPLAVCTEQAVEQAIASHPREQLLDEIFQLFKTELAASDPHYAVRIALPELTLEQFGRIYFHEREQHDPFAWAEQNLAEAKHNYVQKHTVPWRYAILRMHEIIARIVPHLLAKDYQRFSKYFKPIFVDDYATVPHESIERLLALRRAGKLDILSIGEEYHLDKSQVKSGAWLSYNNTRIHFPAFIEATGQRSISAHKFPFPSLWSQGIVQNAVAPYSTFSPLNSAGPHGVNMGGIALDHVYHPISSNGSVSRLYCLSIPFMLGQFPFAQGITSSNDMAKAVANDLLAHVSDDEINNIAQYSATAFQPINLHAQA